MVIKQSSLIYMRQKDVVLETLILRKIAINQAEMELATGTMLFQVWSNNSAKQFQCWKLDQHDQLNSFFKPFFIFEAQIIVI